MRIPSPRPPLPRLVRAAALRLSGVALCSAASRAASDGTSVEFWPEINGEPSQRYRVRIGSEWEEGWDGHPFSPYTSIEAIYDTRYEQWSRLALKALMRARGHRRHQAAA